MNNTMIKMSAVALFAAATGVSIAMGGANMVGFSLLGLVGGYCLWLCQKKPAAI
jgi:hypothetical protein